MQTWGVKYYVAIFGNREWSAPTSLTIVISSPSYTQFWHWISLFRSNISNGQAELLYVSLRDVDTFRGENRRQRMGRCWESRSSNGTAFWSQSGWNKSSLPSHSGIRHLQGDTRLALRPRLICLFGYCKLLWCMQVEMVYFSGKRWNIGLNLGKICDGDTVFCVITNMISFLVYFSTLKMEATCSPKRRAVSQLHVVTTQKTLLFIVTAVRTSDPTTLCDMLQT
jgi:hypothetical protein